MSTPTISPDIIAEIAGQMIREWQAAEADRGEWVLSPAQHALAVTSALRFAPTDNVLSMNMIYDHPAIEEVVEFLCPDPGVDAAVDRANEFLASVVDAVIDELADIARSTDHSIDHSI